MPVPPSSPSVGRYTSYSSYSSYRTPSSSTFVGRTTSLDRSASYSNSYGSGSGYSSSSSSSTYTSKYSRPPRPSYSSSTDTYRSSRSLRQSPVRPTYSRLTSDTTLEGTPAPKYTSRYSATRDSINRETSTSRDSGYGSRFTSRDRSVDLINGNSVDTSHFGPSPSSYACNYRWEARDKDDEKDTEAENEKVRITDRIRAFETRNVVGLLAGRESSSTVRDNLPSEGRDSSYLSEKDSSIARRRIPISLSADVTSLRSGRRTSPEATTGKDGSESTVGERRPSVTELCRKYDSNHNVSNGVTRQEDEEEGSDGSVCSGGSTNNLDVIVPRKSRQRTDSCNEQTDSPVSTLRVDSSSKHLDSPSRTRVDSPSGSILDSQSRSRLDSPALLQKESSAKTRLDSPSSNHRDSPIRNRLESQAESTNDRDGHASPLVNGTVDKTKYRVEVDTGYDGATRSRYRRDRMRERIAARLARETEDEDSPTLRHQSSIGSSTSTSSTSIGGILSENNGLVGLRNIGNTCFMNSVTQCLSNTRCLLEYLVRDGYSSDINTSTSTMRGDLVRAFATLLSDMWSEGADNSRALNTGPFKSQIQRFAPAFSGYQQHDAQEFLRKLLEGLHEDVNRVIVKPRPITEDIDDDLDDNQKAMESWKRYLRYDDSKIVDMFVGQLKSSLQCSVCGHCSVTFDPFWDLSLPIPSKSGQVRLAQCLDLFTKEEVLDGDERPTCSKCKERRKMTKSFSIQKFPKVLVLHLKRFSPLERWRGKLSCTVEFPLEALNLSRYASKSATSPLYNLIGIANHSGTTYSGHYTAYCKHPYSGSWHEYNDSRVSHISMGRICSPEAYVLFYELTSSSSKL